MKLATYFFVISIALVLATVITIFLFGRMPGLKSRRNKLKRIWPATVVILLISSFAYMYFQYDESADVSQANFITISTQKYLDDIYKMDINSSKKNLLDSLEEIKFELMSSISRLEKQNLVTGKKSEQLQTNKYLLEKTSKYLSVFSKFIQKTDIREVYPNFKGTIQSGDSAGYLFSCPTDTVGEYTYINFFIPSSEQSDKIGGVYLIVHKYEGNKTYVQLNEGFYKPQIGENVIRLRNYPKSDSTELVIGFLSKRDTLAEYPRLVKITCR